MRSSTDVKTKVFIVCKTIIIFKQMKVVVVVGGLFEMNSWMFARCQNLKKFEKMGGKNICHLRKFLKGVENIMSIVWGG